MIKNMFILFNILIFGMSFFIFYNNIYMLQGVIILLVINFLYYYFFYKKKNVIFFIFALYISILYIQYVLIYKNPIMFINFGINYYSLENVENLMRSLYSAILFFCVFFITLYLLDQLKIKNFNIKSKVKKIRINIKPFYLLIIISIIEFLIRKKFNIAVPGKKLKIEIPYITNLIYYSFIAIKLILLKKLINFSIVEQKNTFYSYIYIFIYSFPSILLGWRGSFFSIFNIFFLYNLIIMTSKKRRKFIINTIILGFPIVTLSIFVASMIRGSALNKSSKLFHFLINRFIGWSDSIAIENYLNNGGKYAFNYLFEGKYPSIASFYTIVVRGYPEGVIHANSRPIFSSLKLVYGNVAIVFGAIILSFLFYFLENILKHNRYKYLEREVFLWVYVIYRSFEVVVFAGDFDSFIQQNFVLILVYLFVNSHIVFKIDHIIKIKVKIQNNIMFSAKS
ncbi:hypothetical protein SAMN02745164_01785 [Marinitoga hydrogenitolerans DSM 16785]|uniref:O-antigen polymerase n=1 Tax=Marinitoga hydrogenitolerans (strain DSM 16785 / JCM 12826 / AT1271) TaxID=1122195 RepID=A0A1M4YWR3_MARH1|nr:hypothetical protein [Marinitoga hydrogenitolerans]SHF10264.1 hypothetical protein SAMN02745164_01785 [Marinitoga hydrogenitolerans DSM 16785]